MKKRTIFACAFIALLFVILIGRLVYFSVFKNNIYKRQVLSQQNYSSETLPYKRGDILDRDGNLVAAISISGPTARFANDTLEEKKQAILEMGRRVSHDWQNRPEV